MSISRQQKQAERHYDVVVIGGGASGMMAAGRAAERGKRVLLLEKNKELGKKLSITGGGRCNITNNETDIHALLAHFGDGAKFLYSSFAQFGVGDTFAFFERRGLPLVTEARKRVFPRSQSAKDVTKIMSMYVGQPTITVRKGIKVLGFQSEDRCLTAVKTTDGTFTGDAFIVATGGVSRPETGSTGEAFTWLTKLGHTVHTPNPDIVPLITDDPWVHALSGTTLSFMKITFGSGKEKISRKGKILFTHFGLSSPLILNVAKEVKKLLQKGPVEATIDLYPDTEIGTLRNRVLGSFNEHKNKLLKNILKDLVPAGMGKAVGMLLGEALLNTKVHSISKEDRQRLVDLIKAMPLTVTGTKGYDWAVVSDGGVDLAEVDTRTMASKHYPNLFLTGDVLHISRPSGGYSLQLCWTTGWIAGSHA